MAPLSSTAQAPSADTAAGTRTSSGTQLGPSPVRQGMAASRALTRLTAPDERWARKTSVARLRSRTPLTRSEASLSKATQDPSPLSTGSSDQALPPLVGAPGVCDTRLTAPVARSATKTLIAAPTWPLTRSVASLANATQAPSALSAGAPQLALPALAAAPGRWDTSEATPVARDRRKTSSASFVSAWPLTRLVAPLLKASQLPSLLKVRSEAPALAVVVALPAACETSVATPLARPHR